MSPIPLGILAASGPTSTEWDLIAEHIVVTPSTSITISNLPQDYETFQIWMNGRNQSGQTPTQFFIRPNNLSTNIYSYQAIISPNTWTNVSSTSSMLVGHLSSDNTWNGEISTIVTIDGVTSSVMKTWQSRNGHVDGFNGQDRNTHSFGSMQTSSDITSLTIFSTSNFNTDYRISIYGVR